MTGVLDGLRVLDLSQGIAGPMATMLLADHGAVVTKIEPPGGDPFRAQLGYHAWNRGKRSAILDLKDPADLDTFRALARRADIVAESFRPGVSDRLGIDWQTLSATNPRLIYCSITGYGRGNADSDRPGWDALVAARSGLHWEQRGRPGGSSAALAGAPPFAPDYEVPQEAQQGAPREGPLFPASRLPSLGAAFAAATAISAALRAREVTGRGQWVETSLLQGALCAGAFAYSTAQNINAPGFLTWVGDSRAPKGIFKCGDGRWVHHWVPNPRFVLSASEGDSLSAKPDLSARQDPDRIGLGPEELFVLHHYYAPMAKAFKKFTADEWTEAAATAQVCVQKVRSPEEALADPLLLADGCVAELDDPQLGPIRAAGILYKLGNSPGRVGAGQPTAGRHSDEVRAEAAAALAAPAPAPPPPGRALPLGPLEGIRVLDFGLAMAGPYGAQLLSDLGADVIKVNALHDWYWHSCQIAMACNRGKRSIAIDLKHPKARESVRRLIASADVLIHNMRYRAATKLGLDYESLRDEFPRLVYCHTRGFERGPREALPGNDQTGACLAGVEWEDGGCERGGRPLWSLTSLGDTGNGFLAAIGICQALYEREKTGRGQWVETAIVNAHLLGASHTIARADGSGFERPKLDSMQTGFNAGVRIYPCAEGWICLSLVRDAHWEALAGALDLAELRAGGRFATSETRAQNDEDLANLLARSFASRSAKEWFAALDAAGAPVEISSESAVRELWSDPAALDHQWLARHPHDVVGETGQVGLAFSFSDTPARVQGPPVLVGEHTREILRELGIESTEIEALFSARAVGDRTVYPAFAEKSGDVAASPWDPKS